MNPAAVLEQLEKFIEARLCTPVRLCTETCPRCGGTGQQPEYRDVATPMPCGRCHGTGEVTGTDIHPEEETLLRRDLLARMAPMRLREGWSIRIALVDLTVLQVTLDGPSGERLDFDDPRGWEEGT